MKVARGQRKTLAYSVFGADSKSVVGFSEDAVGGDEKQSTMVENHCFGHP
jgi:hypothetical protein